MIAFKTSDLQNLVVPIDDFGQRCGMEYIVRDRPNVMYFDLLECISFSALFRNYGCPTVKVCVKKCPEKTFVFDQGACENNLNNTIGQLICIDGFRLEYLQNCEDVQRAIKEEKCAGFHFDSEESKCAVIRCFFKRVISQKK